MENASEPTIAPDQAVTVYEKVKTFFFFFYLQTPPILHAEIPHCQKISQSCDLMQFRL